MSDLRAFPNAGLMRTCRQDRTSVRNFSLALREPSLVTFTSHNYYTCTGNKTSRIQSGPPNKLYVISIKLLCWFIYFAVRCSRVKSLLFVGFLFQMTSHIGHVITSSLCDDDDTAKRRGKFTRQTNNCLCSFPKAQLFCAAWFVSFLLQ